MDILIPSVGESISEVIIGQWLKEDGASVSQDEIICELESDKANFELRAEIAGVLQHIAKAGDTIPIGALACRIDPSTAPSAAAPAASAAPTAPTSAAPAAPVAATAPTSAAPAYTQSIPSPAADKILREKGISPATIAGTGTKGRITKADATAAKQSAPTESSSPVPLPPQATSTQGDVQRRQHTERLSTLRKTIARRLVQVKNETAMLSTFNEIDMAPVIALRTRHKAAFKEKYEVNLGFMSFFTKAVCMAISEIPSINAQITAENILYHDYCDISIAVSTPKGLVVPVVRSAERMGFDQIEKEIVRLATQARNGKLSIAEMSGGTFTITNGGVFGSLLSTPIINAPQAAILGMHNIVQRPVVVDNQIVIRPMMYVALSYDHRIVDGKESVTFLVRLKELLEDPSRLMLGV